MEFYTKKKTTNDEYYKKVVEKTEKKYATDLSTVSVGAFLDKANKYFASADEDLKSNGYSTSSKNAKDRLKQAQELRQEALGVDRYLDVNRSTMDESTYKTLKQYVSEIGYETAKVTDAFDTANDYYSQFTDREKVNDFREGLRQNAWLDKYQGKNSTDLFSVASSLKDGDEKNWVTRLANSKQYDEMMSYDTKQGTKDIEALMRQADEDEKEYWDLYNLRSSQMYTASMGQTGGYAADIDSRMQAILDKYGANNINEIRNMITDKQVYNTQAERLQEGVRLSSVGDKESEYYDPEYDYWAKTRGKLPTREDVTKYDSMMDQSKWYTDSTGKLYDAYGTEIDTSKTDDNGNIQHPSSGSVDASDKLGIFLSASDSEIQDATATYLNTGNTWDAIVAEGSQKHWNQMRQNEIDTYYYYLNKDGVEAADKYLNSIQEDLNRREGTQMFKRMEDKTAQELIFGVAAGLDQFASGLEGLRNAVTRNDDYIPASATQFASSMVREDLADQTIPLWYNFKDKQWSGSVFGSSVGQAAYDTITTTTNMLPSILVSSVVGALNPAVGSALGTGLLGSSAGGNAYTEMINFGYNKDQARFYAALVGTSEAVLQNLLGGISDLGGGAIEKGITKVLGKADNVLAKLAIKLGNTAVGQILINAVEEGSEEYLQEILEPWLRNAIFGEENEINLLSEEALYSALLGAITGGVFEGASVASNAAKSNAVTREVGQIIMAADGGVDALKALALDVSGANSKLAKQAEKVTGKTAVGENLTGKAVAAVKNRANEKRIGKLYDAVRSEVTKQNRSDIAQLLGEKGLSKSSANNIADAVAAALNGEELDKFQEMVLDQVKDNKGVADAVNTILQDDASNLSKRTTDLSIYSQGVAHGKGIAPEKTARPDFDVSQDGKTILHNTDGTAREVEVKKVSSIENGKVKLELNDGTVVDADQISFATTGEAWAYSVMAEIGATAEEANDILSFYKGETNIDRVAFARGVQEAYRYGTIGVPVDKISAASFASRMSPEARAYAYNVGAIQAVKNANVKYNERISKKLGKGKYHDSFTIERNGVHFDDVDINTEKLNAYQKTGIQLAEFLAALGMDVHVFKSQKVDGKYVSENGSYIMDDGSIHVDLMAGNIGQGTVAYTLSHEVTHFIKDWSPEKFKVFADALFTEVGKSDVDIEKMVAGSLNRIKSMKEYKGKSEAELWDIAYDEVVAEMCETMLTDTDVAVRVAENLKKTDSELLNKIIEFFNNLLTKLKGLLKVNAAYKNATPDSYIAQQASETIKKVEKLRDLYAEALVDATATFRNAQTVEAVGIQVDAETESVAPMELHSERTWTASEYVQNREKAAQAISKQLNVSVKEALQYIDDINSVARLIADDRVRLDYDSNVDEHATVLKPNSEYKYTVDMSTLCAKRLLFTGTFDAIQRALPDTVFDSEDIVHLREMMMQRNLEVACGICYVESTRREIGRITQEFIDRYKIAQKTGQPISRINSSGKEVTLSSKGVTFKADPNYTPNLGELNTTDIDYVKRDHREVYDAYLAFMNARGQAKPKLLETRAEYKGEILKSFKSKSAVESRNAHGGLRLQSFSDFEVPHLIDMMQIIMDMSRVGLKSQAYTKVPAFAEVFGGTGVKINLSLIAKGSGLDAKGNLIFDDVEGINHKEAFRLRDKYSKNVGTILVGKNDQHIIAAMADPRIDYIIPFHKSSWKESLYDALGLTGYDDYTETQNEKPFDKSRDIKNFDPSEYWDFTKTGDENAQIYLEKCREDGRIPKFPQFQGYPGYWKLLIDFKMYDNNGVGSPQKVVSPRFDMDAARSILNDYKGGHRSFPVAKDVVNDFVNEYKAKNTSEVRKSSRYDSEYMNAVKRGDMNTVEKMVAEAAESSGLSTEHLFHGTAAFGFTTIDTSESDDSISFFATNNPEVAQGYMPWYEDDASDKYHNEPRRIGKGVKNRAITNKSSIANVITILNETFNNEYRDARPATDQETLDSFKVYHIPEMVDAASKLIGKNVPANIKELCKLVVEANKKDTFGAWAEVSKRYKEFETAEIPYDPNDWSNDILWSRVVVDLQSIAKMARTEPVWNDGAVIMKSALVDRYNTFLGGEAIGMYDFYGSNKNQMVVWGEGSNWKSIPLGEHDAEYRKWLLETRGVNLPQGRPVRASTRDISAFAKYKGYRSVVFVDIYDSGAYGDRGVLSDVFSFFYPQEDIKSADPVTYDDDGNVIPLSKRFDVTNKDIRYSTRVKVDTTGMDEGAKKIISKLELVSRFSKYDSGKYASYTTERMDREISRSTSATRMDYAKSYIAWVRPDDFLYATTTSEQVRSKIDAEAGDLDLERLRKETQPIHLTVDFETGKVVGHEGRHRMTALAKAGVEKVAVIFDAWNDDRYNTKPISMMKINGQVFDRYHYGNWFYAHDMIPISKRYADAVRQLFTDVGGSVRFSERATDSVSNRSLLANALDSAAQHEVEKSKLNEYKSKIAAMDAEEQRLSDINAQIKEISFGKGPRDKAKLSKLQDEKTKIQNRIHTYDKQLLRLESTKVLQSVLEREKQRAYKRAEVRGQEALEAYKKSADKRFENFAKKQEEKRKNAVEARNRTEIRHKIQRVVKELNDLLLNESKTRHVPDNLKKAVAGALSILNMDTVNAEERAAKYAALIAKERAKDEPDQDKIDAYTSTMESILRKGEKMGQQLKNLRDAYEEIKTSADPDIALGYDEVIAGAISELSQTIGDTSIMDMSIEQLSDVYDVYKMVLTRVRDANKAMAENIKESITKLASNVIAEVKATGGQRKMRASALDPAMKFMWNNLKPVYAMEYIGSSTLTHVYNNVRAGEDVWAKDVVEARSYYLDKAKRYGYNDWDLDKKYRFTSDSGIEFDLTLEQMLSLYAYSKREQAADHLRLGGFVFDSNIETYDEAGNKLGKLDPRRLLNKIIKYKVNTADAHQITPEILTEIIGKLTSEQLGFVDDMQAYLSTVMGAKGNEVTSKMYGVKLFKEKNYFPLKSASQFMFEQNQVAGEVKIKNSGFTNKVVAKANNPIILSNFMDVWSNHVNDMSMYHAFTLPLEDFNRVFNFDSPKKEGIPPQSVKGTLQNAYTPAAVHYIKQLITDLNGGARTDPATGPLNWLMGKFKKGAVFASASVVIQQPSAIARATALIDTKYFIGPKIDQKKHNASWEEVKKYAPVAIIKEMGYFDTNMGKSTQDYIQGKEYETFKEKSKAFFTDSGFRDEVLSKAPALADEIAWVGIWEAVKRETKAKHPGLDVKGEPFLKLAGSRFTEVITKTQVYDSVLSRSANMRSKDTGMKMATAFMAEPTTSINMVHDALMQGKRGNKKYARQAIGSVIASMLLNSMLVSIVYAARDDDEDQKYWEKYLESFLGSALDGLNPATYIPFIKDIVSIVQGYEVERSDMAVISDLYNAFTKLKSDKVSTYRKIEDFAGSVAQIFGLPVKNIMRDFRSLYQARPDRTQKYTSAGFGYAALSAIGKDVSDQEQLYRAYVNGNAAHLARVEGRYTTKKKAYTAMRSAIKDHYLAGDIDDATAISYMVNYCDDDENDAYWKLEEWRHNAKFEEDFGKYNEFYAAVQTGKDLKATIKKYTDNGVTEETLRSQITDGFKDDYIKMSNAERANIKGYLLNAMTVLGNTRKEAEDKIKDWEFEAANGFSYNNRKQEYLEGDITREQLENALVDYGGLDEEEVEDYFSDVLFEAEYGFAYNNTGKLYKDGELTRDEAYKIFTTQGEMSDEKANIKLKSLDFEIEHGYSYDEKKNKFLDGDITAAELKKYIMSVEGKTEEEASSALVSYVRDAYSNGEIDKNFAINTMTNYAGVEREDAESKLRYIDIKKQYPDTYVDDAWVEEYYEEVESSGIAMDVFFDYRNQVKGITGKGKKEGRLAVINSMPISNAQKDALYYAEGWAKSKIYEAPWH